MPQESQSKLDQKKVKIIGLKIHEQMGILHSCQMDFDSENHLIAIKGSVGSGKTTLQKSLQLGTLGSDVLKHDKQLFGNIDQEVQLMDGDTRLFVGCKSTEDGGLDFILYQKDETGKKIKNPVIDGVKATPANYLKTLQTELTWRMDDLMSENPTIQKNLLLQLFKSELIDLGVVFDKKHSGWNDSILGQIEVAENERSLREFERKSVGGFANQLEPLGIDVDDDKTWPIFIDSFDLTQQKQQKIFEFDNVSSVKEQKLCGIMNRANAKINEIKSRNNELKELNRQIEQEFEKKKTQYSQNIHTFNGIKTDLQTLVDQKCLTLEEKNTFIGALTAAFNNDGATCGVLNQLVEFDGDKITTKVSEWTGDQVVKQLLDELTLIRREYVLEDSRVVSDEGIKTEIEQLTKRIDSANANNKKRQMLDAFLSWRDANKNVLELRAQYAALLSSVNTGVEGLKINVNRDGDAMEIFMTYNGAFDPKYFSNIEMEDRKLTSYSGTQKPLICLLLQNYLLSKKPKALRYLWIDNVPIDNKTKVFLQQMGEKLDVTIIVNITGDFSRETLQNGEVLLEGGEVFFKN